MFSRAHVLVEQQIAEANEESSFKVARLNDKSIFEVIAQITGPPNTLWSEGIFQLYFKFDETYNQMPPLLWFLTIPFHPNVDQYSGRLNLDFIDNISKWRQLDESNRTIKFTLYAVQRLLNNPFLDRAVNIDAVFMLKNNPDQYENIIMQSVSTSHKLKLNILDACMVSTSSAAVGGLDQTTTTENRGAGGSAKYFLHQSSSNNNNNQQKRRESDSSKLNNYNQKQRKEQHKELSFADYLIMWRDIGTAKSSSKKNDRNSNDENLYLKEQLLPNPHLIQQHLAISLKELELQLNQQLIDHKNLMYGNIDFTTAKFKNTNQQQQYLSAKQMLTKQQKQHKQPVNNVLNVGINYNNLRSGDGTGTTADGIGGDDEEEMTAMMNININIQPKNSYDVKFSPSADEIEIRQQMEENNRNEDERFNDEEVDDLIQWTQNLT